MDPNAGRAIQNKSILRAYIQNEYENTGFLWDELSLDVLYSEEDGFSAERHKADGMIPFLLENRRDAYGLFVRTCTDEEYLDEKREIVYDQMRDARKFLQGEYPGFVDTGAVIFLEGWENYETLSVKD